jgi:hypothetical protein
MGEGALFVLTLISSAYSYSEQRKAALEAREARAVESASQRQEGVREARRVARQARIRRAQLRQAAENTGTGTGSGVAGATASVTSQEASAGSFLQGRAVAASGISSALQRSADSQFRSQVASGLSDLFFQAGGQQGAINFFSGEGGTQTPAGGAQFQPVTPRVNEEVTRTA